MYSGYYPDPRPCDEVIELVGLAGKRNTRVVKLSGGQQRRLDVAIALAGNPDLLFLDEPTTGFDPSARHEAWAIVKNLAALGKTVLLTTHYMDEAQHLADRVALVTAGRILAEGPPASLGDGHMSGPHVRYRRPAGGDAPSPPDDLLGTTGADGVTDLVPADLTLTLNRLTGWALEQGIKLDDIEVVRPSLEDVYLALTGSAAKPGSAAEPDQAEHSKGRRPARRRAR
jgi:ABC-2 type transport system ATP-binding protein